MGTKRPNPRLSTDDGLKIAPVVGASTLSSEREELARFVRKNEGKIRAIARRKLSDRARTWTDSEDIVGSVYLRLDGYLQRGELKYNGLNDLWPLIAVIAERRAIDRSRLSANAARLLKDESDCDHLIERMATHEKLDATEFVLRVLAKIESSQDRLLMMLMLRGARSDVAGDLLGMSSMATRARWSRLRRRLAAELREELDQ